MRASSYTRLFVWFGYGNNNHQYLSTFFFTPSIASVHAEKSLSSLLTQWRQVIVVASGPPQLVFHASVNFVVCLLCQSGSIFIQVRWLLFNNSHNIVSCTCNGFKLQKATSSKNTRHECFVCEPNKGQFNVRKSTTSFLNLLFSLSPSLSGYELSNKLKLTH